MNNKKYKNLTININPFIKKYLVDNFKSEISNIENETSAQISFVDDITIGYSEISIEDESKDSKKTEQKSKKKIAKKRTSAIKKKTSALKKSKIKDKDCEDAIVSPIKEIKDKKSGWWQK